MLFVYINYMCKVLIPVCQVAAGLSVQGPWQSQAAGHWSHRLGLDHIPTLAVSCTFILDTYIHKHIIFFFFIFHISLICTPDHNDFKKVTIDMNFHIDQNFCTFKWHAIYLLFTILFYCVISCPLSVWIKIQYNMAETVTLTFLFYLGYFLQRYYLQIYSSNFTFTQNR